LHLNDIEPTLSHNDIYDTSWRAANVIRNAKRLRASEEDFVVPVYRRPSRRGGNGSKREVIVTSLFRVSGTYRRRQQIVPYIRLSGIWLQRLGFRRGARIEITEERGRLVLTVIREAAALPIN
jgi:hypothetical protein